MLDRIQRQGRGRERGREEGEGGEGDRKLYFNYLMHMDMRTSCLWL